MYLDQSAVFMFSQHQYAFDAVKLLEECLAEIQEVVETNDCPSAVYDMKEALTETERQLHIYFYTLVKKEIEDATPEVQKIFLVENPCSNLESSADFLAFIMQEKTNKKENKGSDCIRENSNAVTPIKSYYPRRSATDSLLFRLHVALQLCMVRINDTRLAVCGKRPHESITRMDVIANRALHRVIKPVSRGLWGLSALCWLNCNQTRSTMSTSTTVTIGGLTSVLDRHQGFIFSAAKSALALVSIRWIHQRWTILWLSMKIARSIEDLEEWIRQWSVISEYPRSFPSPPSLPPAMPPLTPKQKNSGQESQEMTDSSITSVRSKRLIEYALHETPKTSFWHSQGEIRFLMVKRAMDVFYASVGTAIDWASDENWQKIIVTAAAASFYSLTGARDRAASVTSSSERARSLIKNAWGMVSLPAVKTLSLQATRLLKGAAVADRIEICGVSCFVLSSEPMPELAAAIKRNHRFHKRRKPIATLSTIHEQEEHAPETRSSNKPFARFGRYRQRDVIFHLTGGGFFAHIIASDLPYLLDWSASTGAVVICPEYALLPEHTFPDALDQVSDVYKALATNGAVSELGFETNRIVVTGESTGGNLAASLCISLPKDVCLDASLSKNESNCLPIKEVTAELPPIKFHNAESMRHETSSLRMPDAIMLSCPVLNLSLELCHSRVIGTEDPVLPSGLLSAISDAYLPRELGVSKKDPLASPFYASDHALGQFPPTLLFASSTDPLLDDSVVFNRRLRTLGVDSQLIAAHNVPHAYLGLGMAGFPEVRQVQEHCKNWLSHQLTREDVSH